MPALHSFTATKFLGLDLTSNPEEIGPGLDKPGPTYLTVAENVRFNREGGVYTRKGFEQKADLASSAKVDNIFTMPEYSVMFCKSGTKIYQSLDGITWYDIGVTRTAAEREFFFSFGKSVYATNRTDSFLRIQVSTLATAITTGSTEVVVRTGDGAFFDASGAKKIYIEGDEIDYNGVTTDTLGSVTNIAASHAVATIITQTSTPSGAPKGSCMSELEGSALVGGVSANKNIIYYSAAATVANPEFFYDYSANGAGSKETSGHVNALYKAAGIVMIGMENGIDYAYAFDVDTGALLTRDLTKSHGVPNAFCITYVENNTFAVFTGRRILLIVADAGGVRIIDDPFRPKNALDYPVRAFLQSLDDDQGLSFIHFDPTTRELYISAIKDGIAQILVCNMDNGAWAIDTGKPYACMANFKFRVYAGDDNDDKVYLDSEDTRDNTITIRHRIVLPLFTAGDVTSDYLHLKYSGLLSAIGEYTQRIYINGSVALSEDVLAEDLQNAGLMSLSSGVPLGSGVIGAENIGTAGEASGGFQFRYPWEFLLTGERAQVEFELNDEGAQMELRKLSLTFETDGELELDSQ